MEPGFPSHLPLLAQPGGRGALPSFSAPGARIPHALHSRLHDVPWLRSLRPEPEADLALEDAAPGNQKGDAIELFTAVGAIGVKANPTARVLREWCTCTTATGRRTELADGPGQSGPLLRVPGLPFHPLRRERKGRWEWAS